MVVRVGGWRGRVGGGGGWTWTRGAGNRSVYSCCVSSFFFFFSFSKNVTIKIPKIKSLPGPQPLVPQPPPPKKRPLGGGGGKEEKKKREKKPTFLFSFFSGGPRVFEAVEEVRG